MVFSSNESNRGRSVPGTREGNLSIIAAGMTVTGDVVTDGVVKVEGRVEGTVRAERQVLVAKGGVVQGDIYTREAVIGGEVVGSIAGEQRVEVQPDAMVRGDILTRRLVVQEGGEVNGSVRMGDAAALSSSVAAGADEVPQIQWESPSDSFPERSR